MMSCFLNIYNFRTVASEMKLLLDAAGRLGPALPDQQRAELDLARRKLLETSRSFSTALKSYFSYMSEYSSIDSSEGDYTEPEGENKTVDDYFLFQNVRKIARRKRRKMAPEEYRKTKEKKKLIEYVSESDSSSDDDYIHLHPSSAHTDVSFQAFISWEYLLTK